MQTHPSTQNFLTLFEDNDCTQSLKIQHAFHHYYCFSYPNRLGGLQDEFFYEITKLINSIEDNLALSQSLNEIIKNLHTASKDQVAKPSFYSQNINLNSEFEIQSGILKFIEFLSLKCSTLGNANSLKVGISFQTSTSQPQAPWWTTLLKSMRCDAKNSKHDFVYHFFGSLFGKELNQLQFDEPFAGDHGTFIYKRLFQNITQTPGDIINHPSFFDGLIQNLTPSFASLPCVLSMIPSNNHLAIDNFFGSLDEISKLNILHSLPSFNDLHFTKNHAEKWSSNIEESPALQKTIKEILNSIPNDITPNSQIYNYFKSLERTLLSSTLQSSSNTKTPTQSL